MGYRLRSTWEEGLERNSQFFLQLAGNRMNTGACSKIATNDRIMIKELPT